MNAKLYDISLQKIAAAQDPSGGIIACPSFRTYHYSWLRDGSFIAYALDRCGHHGEAARFYRWVDRVVRRLAPRVEDAIARAQAGEAVDPARELLHCRFTLDGEEGTEEWGNFQLDGWGAFLWGLAEHQLATGDEVVMAELLPTARLVARYLRTFWQLPCFDCWEENGDKVHPATLANLYGGLMAIAPYLSGEERSGAVAAAVAIRQRVLAQGVKEGRLTKWFGGDGVDASLLWCTLPFGMFDLADPIVTATVAEIEAGCLGPHGGVHRYPEDTYYGGGAWVLLTAWLGWYYARTGRRSEAEAMLHWCEAQMQANGDLPEQVAVDLHDPAYYPHWVGIWGEPASPLTWSHAMYLVLAAELAE